MTLFQTISAGNKRYGEPRRLSGWGMGEGAQVLSLRSTRRLVFLAVIGVPCVVAVAVYGELSTGALVAVATTGALLAGIGLAQRAGEAARPVRGRGLPWLVWLAAAMTWELVTLLDARLRTLSDLMDPVLAHPVPRGAATVGWLAAGAWLLTRPRRSEEAR